MMYQCKTVFIPTLPGYSTSFLTLMFVVSVVLYPLIVLNQVRLRKE